MRDELQKRFGYRPPTIETKLAIFGRSSARVYGVDIEAKRGPIPRDWIDRLRMVYRVGRYLSGLMRTMG